MTDLRIAQALRDATTQLAQVSDTARLDAEVLMAVVLGVSRSDLLLRHMAADVPGGFAELVARRMTQEPVAYITGEQEFYGRPFRVNRDVLIPRGDSEAIVEAALAAAPTPRRVLDCGTGSGALLLTVLAERPEAHGVGIDRSEGALAVAQDNAVRLGLADRALMLRRDWDEQGWAEGLTQFDLILANPPYVEENADISQSVRGFEPGGALFAGPAGLDAYRVLLPQLVPVLADKGIAVVEIGAAQADLVGAIARNAGFDVQLTRDLGGRPRALTLRFGLGKAE
ncbi:peptide chain release factor N(5)-glutamine methyltransferase [Caenibius tardaugens]|uniref:peptide chain release factor N(5)-glutamine methyltransferase n=1 Tax=Caenibius tardaugens TaxID=169176 RepID=UPI000421CDB4|nr:peptide chain release factor N(5)-glutamine methyltransferase [Caenibius tardaugens]AZI34902.1 peptide chain release factor N(5)-glutamine methyltransferase [Caenibius tardaugens NBRC 16725]